MKRLKIYVTVPTTHADKIRQVLAEAGAGRQGNYSHCSFSVKGQGRFLPNTAAKPFVGQPDHLETVSEEKIEVTCDRAHAKQILQKLRAAHPYEEPTIDIIELINEEEI